MIIKERKFGLGLSIQNRLSFIFSKIEMTSMAVDNVNKNLMTEGEPDPDLERNQNVQIIQSQNACYQCNGLRYMQTKCANLFNPKYVGTGKHLISSKQAKCSRQVLIFPESSANSNRRTIEN